jgi:hypothetical protein
MNFNILQQFRQALYGCFEQGRDALFNLADALLSETTAHSVIELTLSPFFERKWPSLYAALQLGKLDQVHFEQTLINFAPPPLACGRLVLAVDASNIERQKILTASARLAVSDYMAGGELTELTRELEGEDIYDYD